MVKCNKTRGRRLYKQLRVISKVSITGNTLFSEDHNIKATSVLSIIFFIMLGDVTSYDLQKT